jgi:Type IV secretory pathway, VirJ component
MKKIFLASVFSIAILYVSAQDFTTKEWPSHNNSTPLIFYISGDGGFNKFSDNLCESLNKKGFNVVALNSKSYFWNKKTPEETTIDINNYLSKKMAGRKNQQVLLIGYSFGADVLPFILNRLPKNMHEKIVASILMGSSGSTDFEIHWSDIFGSGRKRDMDVVTEINKLSHDKIVILTGSDNQELDPRKITLKKYTLEILPGGHHFDGNTEEITRSILKHI